MLKRTFMGVLLSAMVLFGATAQKAQAAIIEFSPPVSEFYYLKNTTSWYKNEGFAFEQAADGNVSPEAITYLSFDVSGSVFDDPGYSTLGALSLVIHDVTTALGGSLGTGTLMAYRVDDESVLTAPEEVADISQAPIALGDYLGEVLLPATLQDEQATLSFINPVSAGMYNGSSYLSFALISPDSLTLTTQNSGSFQIETPVPEPSTLAFGAMGLLGLLRRRRK